MISYIFHVVACLEPMSEELRENIIQRVLSTLLQQKMITEFNDVSVSTSQSFDQLLRRTTNDGLMKPDIARRVLLFFTLYLQEQKENVCSCRHRSTCQLSQSTFNAVQRSNPANH